MRNQEDHRVGSPGSDPALGAVSFLVDGHRVSDLAGSLLHLKVLFSLHYDLCCRGFVLKEDSFFSANLDFRHGRRYLIKVNGYIKIIRGRRNADFILFSCELRLSYVHLFKRLIERSLDVGNRVADSFIGVVRD